MLELTFDTGWTKAGRIELVANVLRFSQSVPDVPGLYCLVFDEKTRYYGEAGDLNRRLGDYLIYYEATGIESEFRIHNALMKHGGADIRLAVGGDLQKKSQRCALESRVISEAKDASLTVLNGGTIADRIAFHAREIIRLTSKLSKTSNGVKA